MPKMHITTPPYLSILLTIILSLEKQEDIFKDNCGFVKIILYFVPTYCVFNKIWIFKSESLVIKTELEKSLVSTIWLELFCVICIILVVLVYSSFEVWIVSVSKTLKFYISII